MAKRREFERGFSTGSLAVIVNLLHVDGWNAEIRARELLREFRPDLEDATEDDLAVLRAYNLIK